MQNCTIIGNGATLPPGAQNKIMLGSPASTLYAAGPLGVTCTNTAFTIPSAVGLSVDSSLGATGQVLTSAGTNLGLTWSGPIARTITATGALAAPLASLYVSTGGAHTATLPASANGITVYFKNLATGALTIASTGPIYARGTLSNAPIVVPVGGQVGLVNDGTNWCQTL